MEGDACSGPSGVGGVVEGRAGSGRLEIWKRVGAVLVRLAHRPKCACQFALLALLLDACRTFCNLSLRLLVLSILSSEHRKATNRFWWENKPEVPMKEKFLVSPQDYAR